MIQAGDLVLRQENPEIADDFVRVQGDLIAHGYLVAPKTTFNVGGDIAARYCIEMKSIDGGGDVLSGGDIGAKEGIRTRGHIGARGYLFSQSHIGAGTIAAPVICSPSVYGRIVVGRRVSLAELNELLEKAAPELTQDMVVLAEGSTVKASNIIKQVKKS